MEGMAYGEIASNLGISVNTVKYHIRNAISRLRANLDGYLRLALSPTRLCLAMLWCLRC